MANEWGAFARVTTNPVLAMAVNRQEGADVGKVWHFTSQRWEAYDSGNYGHYVIGQTQLGTSGVWMADRPAPIPSTLTVDVVAMEQTSGSPGEGTDTPFDVRRFGGQIASFSATVNESGIT